MLTAELVHARRRGDRLLVSAWKGRRRERAMQLADAVAAVIESAEGMTRSELRAELEALVPRQQERRLVRGLARLATARCSFEVAAAVEPAMLRERVFLAAAAARAQGRFDRDAVVAKVAAELELGIRELEAGLYADLKATHRVVAVEPIDGPELFARYVVAERQAVLLRAVAVEVRIRAADPGVYRRLFARLKFRRLLWRMRPAPDGDGYDLQIDGPCSLFSSITRYGLQLALILPALEEADRYELRARVLWGRARRELVYELEGGRERRGEGRVQAPEPPRLADEVRRLVQDLERLESGWEAGPAGTVLELPGVGLCVPDLRLRHPELGTVHVEVMGFWSREAVWRRVKLVRAGLGTPIVFCVSERLRVAEAALPEDLPGALLVYKGVIPARRLLERAERVARSSRAEPPRAREPERRRSQSLGS